MTAVWRGANSIPTASEGLTFEFYENLVLFCGLPTVFCFLEDVYIVEMLRG